MVVFPIDLEVKFVVLFIYFRWAITFLTLKFVYREIDDYDCYKLIELDIVIDGPLSL